MSKKIKQIGFLTAIVISIGSTVGAGIFFKNGSIFTNVGGSVGLMATAWIVAAVGIMALGLALVEMGSASTKDGGILEWTRKFLPKKLSKVSSAYMLLIYLPLNYLAMPIYVVMSLQDAIQAFNPDATFDASTTIMMSFGMFSFVALMDWAKHKASVNLQTVLSWAKVLPLVIVFIYGLIALGQDGAVSTATDVGDATSITAYAPALGILASIPAILFAYDGFYAITNLKSDMKDPKKLGSVMALAISSITAIYVVYGIVTGMSGNKDFFGLIDNKYMLFIVNMMIMLAVFGILNSFALITYRMYEDVYNEQPLGVVGFIGKIFKVKTAKGAAIVTSLFITVIFYVVLTIFAEFVLTDTDVANSSYVDEGYAYYGVGTTKLYILADWLTNYTSLMAFLIIVAGVGGALYNRKTQKIKTEKKWYFVPAAIASIVFISVGAIYMLADNIAGMAGLNDASVRTEIMKFVILVVSIAISVVPVFFTEKMVKKQQLEKTA